MNAATTTFPSFTLQSIAAGFVGFPTGRPTLLCFTKEDCPTCVLSMPLVEAAFRAFGDRIDVLAIGQDRTGNEALVERLKLTVPMLDDSALKVSFKYDIETVPTIILTDANGRELRRFIGFGLQDWQDLCAAMATIAGKNAPAIDWAIYPKSRPGCGSKSVEPRITERLQAEAEGSPIRARRIELADQDDVFEFMFDQGLTDGLAGSSADTGARNPDAQRDPPRCAGDHRDGSAELRAADHREGRDQRRDGGMQARVSARRNRGGRSYL